MEWPQITFLVLLLIKFIGATNRELKTESTKNKPQFAGVLVGTTAYYGLLVWLLYMGGFFL